MSKRILILFCAAVVILLIAGGLFIGRTPPEKRWPEVLFQGMTNRTGTNFAVFRIVNHGPGQVMLWRPPRIRTEIFTNSEAASFTGITLKRGDTVTTSIPVPEQNARWQAGFKYDIEGWRGKLEQWMASAQKSAPTQKWVWSDWIGP